MKTLYIVRHAKSSWKEQGLTDFERPLNQRGLHDAPFMGKLMADKKEVPDLILSSPANRAISTAKIFRSQLHLDKKTIVEEEIIYEAGLGNLIKIINNLSETYNSVMLFGHNPGLTYLANYLGDKSIDNIPTCGIVKITFDINSWDEVSDGSGKIVFFEYPKKHFK